MYLSVDKANPSLYNASKYSNWSPLSDIVCSVQFLGKVSGTAVLSPSPPYHTYKYRAPPSPLLTSYLSLQPPLAPVVTSPLQQTLQSLIATPPLSSLRHFTPAKPFLSPPIIQPTSESPISAFSHPSFHLSVPPYRHTSPRCTPPPPLSSATLEVIKRIA